MFRASVSKMEPAEVALACSLLRGDTTGRFKDFFDTKVSAFGFELDEFDCMPLIDTLEEHFGETTSEASTESDTHAAFTACLISCEGSTEKFVSEIEANAFLAKLLPPME